MAKKFPLRITNEKTYPYLEREAKKQKWSINTLINSIIEESIKKDKKKLVKNLE